MLTRRALTTEKEKMDFRKVCQFRMTRDKQQQVQEKLSHYDSEQRKPINFQKRGRPSKLEEAQHLPLYSGPRPIGKAKVDDVKSSLSYVPPIHHSFYNNIVVDRSKNSSNSVRHIG
jgi:hypothetical protein